MIQERPNIIETEIADTFQPLYPHTSFTSTNTNLSINPNLVSFDNTKFDRSLVRGHNRLQLAPDDLHCGTWNVEGLTDVKLICLQQTMKAKGLHFLCIQETRRSLSDYFITTEGFLVVLSGNADNKAEYAGVGFIVAPELRSSVVSFCQASSRFASMKLRSRGGKIAILSVYAPQSGRSFDERYAFFQDLLEFWNSILSYSPKLIFGDLNSRLYY